MEYFKICDRCSYKEQAWTNPFDGGYMTGTDPWIKLFGYDVCRKCAKDFHKFMDNNKSIKHRKI